MAIHGKISSIDSANLDPERDSFVEAPKYWDLGKQLGLYGDNEEEIIATLAKCRIAKGIDLEQVKLKRGRGMKKI